MVVVANQRLVLQQVLCRRRAGVQRVVEGEHGAWCDPRQRSPLPPRPKRTDQSLQTSATQLYSKIHVTSISVAYAGRLRCGSVS